MQKKVSLNVLYHTCKLYKPIQITLWDYCCELPFVTVVGGKKQM